MVEEGFQKVFGVTGSGQGGFLARTSPAVFAGVNTDPIGENQLGCHCAAQRSMSGGGSSPHQ